MSLRRKDFLISKKTRDKQWSDLILDIRGQIERAELIELIREAEIDGFW